MKYAELYDKGGKDMWQYAERKQLKKLGSKAMSNFFKQEIGMFQRTVYDKRNELHNERIQTDWIVTDFETSLLHDEELYKKYESSHGAWFHFDFIDFERNGLLNGCEQFETLMGTKFNSWEIEYKDTSLLNS